MRKHTKLFIPGPVEVSDKTFDAFCTPMIGHRGKEFMALYAEMQPRLQQLLFTKNPVYLATSSAWGVMEAAVRNLVNKRVLNCCCGAFSDKWYDVSLACGKGADNYQVEWGEPILPGRIEEYLRTGRYDALTIIHNETSTGLMNPLAEIAEVMRRYSEVMFIVDSVSSMSGVKIEMDKLGIDVLLAGTQKCFALPPGLTVFSVSERALKRAGTVSGRGYYFDFLEFQKNHEKNQTPSTPSIAHIFALRSKLDEIFAEGLDNRFARHRTMAEMVRGWAKRSGFEMFPRAGYESPTLSCVRNTRNVDVPKLNARLKERHGCVIDGGYGKIKGATFRIAHMGDETPESVQQLLTWLDEAIAGSDPALSP
jgi:aspartate aminotransferase-like enzyme